MSTHTTSFKIAQYILMFLVAVLCVGIIIWVLTAGKKNNDGQPSVDNVIRITNTNPCAAGSGRQIAMQQQINDEIEIQCK